MTDHIVLRSMAFEGRHGVSADERSRLQPFEADVELALDLAPAGRTDDLARTVDYGSVFEVVRAVTEMTSHRLLESLAEAIAAVDAGEVAVIDVRVEPGYGARDAAGAMTRKST